MVEPTQFLPFPGWGLSKPAISGHMIFARLYKSTAAARMIKTQPVHYAGCNKIIHPLAVGSVVPGVVVPISAASLKASDMHAKRSTSLADIAPFDGRYGVGRRCTRRRTVRAYSGSVKAIRGDFVKFQD